MISHRLPMQRRFTVLLILAGLAWLSFMLYYTRFAMLDDALIHLRYATFLHRLHFITFDGVHHSFGTSSLLYVTMLAVLCGVTSSVMLAKLVSVIFYCGVVGLIGWQLRSVQRASMGRRLFGGLLFIMLSAMSIRWLTDGMETSLVAFAVFLLSILTDTEMRRPATGIGRGALLVLFGFLVTLLRVELASLLFLACVAILATRMGEQQGSPRSIGPLAGSICLGIGSMIAMAAVYLHFGTLLPDTALAKSGGHPSLLPVQGMAHVIASSFLLGFGALLLWLVSALSLLTALLQRQCRTASLVAFAACNSSFPIVVMLACLSSQTIEGIRHILWALLFSVFLNTLQLARVPFTAFGWYRRALVACGIIFILLMPIDLYYGVRVMHGRAQTFTQMRDTDLSRFEGKTIIAGDVGFIGYFSQGVVCDINGLVNGRTAARQTLAQRVQSCLQSHPAMVFATREQAIKVNEILPLTLWTACRPFDFVNTSSNDRHYVFVSDPAACVAMGPPYSAAGMVLSGVRP
jgi:hypothetical protein